MNHSCPLKSFQTTDYKRFLLGNYIPSSSSRHKNFLRKYIRQTKRNFKFTFVSTSAVSFTRINFRYSDLISWNQIGIVCVVDFSGEICWNLASRVCDDILQINSKILIGYEILNLVDNECYHFLLFIIQICYYQYRYISQKSF